MHNCWNPPFVFEMGRRHGWGGRHAWGGHRGRGRDFGFFASIFGEPGPRAERGGVKYLVLDAVAEAPRHGYEIMQVIEERSKGAYRPSPGVIYPTLQLLEEMGLVTATDRDGRKTYQITDAGRAELEANRDTVRDFYGQQDESPWEVYADELGDFTRRLVDLAKMVRRAARHGRLNAAAVRKLRKILDEAMAKVEEVFETGRTE
jgi:DNA-binding PadR family transcriptional regulator